MAAIAPTITTVISAQDQLGSEPCKLLTWALGNADTGNPVELMGYDSVSMQVYGSIGGATVVGQGANNAAGTNVNTLADGAGAAVSFTANGMKEIGSKPRWFACASSGGAGTAVTVAMFFRGRRKP